MKPRPTAPSSRNGKSNPTRFPRYQIVLLALIAFLGLTTLSLAAYLVLTPGLSPQEPLIPTLTPFLIHAASTRQALSPGPSPEPGRLILPESARCAQNNQPIRRGTITRILDTGTLEVQTEEGIQRISFAGIQATNQASLGDAAEQDLQALQEMLAQFEGQPILLIKDAADQDTTARKPRYVIANDRFVNSDLVREGHAIALSNAPDQACTASFYDLEQQARAEGLGIWKKPTPIPTRTFMPFVTLDPSTQAGCVCSERPICANFNTHDQAQSCFNACNDYNSLLDEDHDGIACENLP